MTYRKVYSESGVYLGCLWQSGGVWLAEDRDGFTARIRFQCEDDAEKWLARVAVRT